MTHRCAPSADTSFAVLDRWPGVTIELPATWTGERWESEDGRYWFDPAAADRICRFFTVYLRVPRGPRAAKPLELLPWQRDVLFRRLFGWKYTALGCPCVDCSGESSDPCRRDLRRFRKVYLEVGKKNGKSLICSGAALYLLAADGEPSSEVYSAAKDREQARYTYQDAAFMAQESSQLLRHSGLVVHKTAITQPRSNSTYKALSSDAGGRHGLNIHGLIFDELHAQKTRELYDTLYKGTSARMQPVVLLVTTAGSDLETICGEEHEYAQKLIEGVHEDEQYLPIIFAADAEDDWTDPEVWKKANPSLGVGKRISYMEEECLAAQNEPRKLNSFKRLELNIWTQANTIWIPVEQWKACPQNRAGAADLPSLPCVVAFDLSATTDLTAMVAIWKRFDTRPPEELEVSGDGEAPRTMAIDFSIDVRTWFFMPDRRLWERVRGDRVPYDHWENRGWLRTTDGDVVDYDVIRSIFERDLLGVHQVREVACDPWNATQFSTQLLADGVPVVMVRQGYQSLSGASKLLEALVRARRVTHDGSPVMNWCVSNCEVKVDENGNIRPVKPQNQRKRIDGVSALVTGLSRLMVVEEPKQSVYERRGMRWL